MLAGLDVINLLGNYAYCSPLANLIAHSDGLIIETQSTCQLCSLRSSSQEGTIPCNLMLRSIKPEVAHSPSTNVRRCITEGAADSRGAQVV